MLSNQMQVGDTTSGAPIKLILYIYNLFIFSRDICNKLSIVIFHLSLKCK